MTSGTRITIGALGAVGMAATPVVWWLNGPGTAQTVAAVVQGIVSIAAFMWAVLHRPSAPSGPTDKVVRTGKASRGGVAGIRRPGGRGRGSAVAKRTGEATGKNSVSGIDYS
jgi:hypothetical protein